MAIHVLQLGPYPPPEGGVSRNMLAIREELLARGDKCSIVATSRTSGVETDPNVFHPRSPVELVRLLRSIPFDVLHLHVGGEINKRVLGIAGAAVFFARRKSVLTIHSGAYPLSDEAKRAAPMTVAGSIYRRFGGIVAVNDALADVFLRFGVAKERIHKILPFALSLPDTSVQIPATIEKFFADHSPVLLSVGGLERDYDPFFQIEAMEAVLRRYPQGGLLLAGDGSMRAEVNAAIGKSEYAQNVLAAGNIEHAVTLNLIDRADAVLRTTLFDGDAISIREALFLGTPVIATDNGMRPDGVKLFVGGDVDGFVAMIDEAVEHKGAEIREKPVDRRNILDVLSLYDGLLK